MRSLLFLVFTLLTSCSLDRSTLTPCNCAEIAANGVKEIHSNTEISKEEELILISELQMQLAPCEKKSTENSDFKKEYEKCYKEKMRDH